MRRTGWLVCVVIGIPLGLSAGEKEPKLDYAEFSRIIHKVAVTQFPGGFEDASAWGQTIPLPPKLRLVGLRKFIKVGDTVVLPHGAWRRFKGKIEDPDKDLKITVKDFKKLDDKTFRLVMDVDATIFCQGEWQQWQRGIFLLEATGAADATINAAIVCDIGVEVDANKFPPELNVQPKVTELSVNLVELKLRNAPSILNGDKAGGLRNELKEVLRALVKASDPKLKNLANQAIEKSLKEGKGNISAATILKALPMPKK